MQSTEGKKTHQGTKENKAVHLVTYTHKMVEIRSIIKFQRYSTVKKKAIIVSAFEVFLLNKVSFESECGICCFVSQSGYRIHVST